MDEIEMMENKCTKCDKIEEDLIPTKNNNVCFECFAMMSAEYLNKQDSKNKYSAHVIVGKK